jgi:hypothetical protein
MKNTFLVFVFFVFSTLFLLTAPSAAQFDGYYETTFVATNPVLSEDLGTVSAWENFDSLVRTPVFVKRSCFVRNRLL